MAIFPTFIFSGNIIQENVFYDILERQKRLSKLQKQEVLKSKNWLFSKRVNPCFWFKNGDLSNFFCSGNIGKQNVFDDILERKHAFLGYKNKKLKKSKLAIFPKG